MVWLRKMMRVLMLLSMVSLVVGLELDLYGATQVMDALLEASAANAASGRDPYPKIASWEKEIRKDIAVIKRLQGRTLRSDVSLYEQTLTQAFGVRKMLDWQSLEIVPQVDTPMGVVLLLMAITLLYPDDDQLSIERLHAIYGHYQIAVVLYSKQNQFVDAAYTHWAILMR